MPGSNDMAESVFTKFKSFDNPENREKLLGTVNGFIDQKNGGKFMGLVNSALQQPGGPNGFPGVGDFAQKFSGKAIKEGLEKVSNANPEMMKNLPSINGYNVGKLVDMAKNVADEATPAAESNLENPAFKPDVIPGELDTQMTSLENKIHKTLETEIANNFESIINSILKNPTAQDTMTMAIASALKPTLDNAIANTAYLNEMTNATGDKVKKGLSEFYEEYSTNSEEEKPKAFTSFIDKMKRIQKENVGEVEDMKKALDLLGGDPNFKPNKDIGTRMGTVENQLKTIIPVDAINKKTKTVGGSRKRKQRRRTHKKRRFQPKK